VLLELALLLVLYFVLPSLLRLDQVNWRSFFVKRNDLVLFFRHLLLKHGAFLEDGLGLDGLLDWEWGAMFHW